MLLTICSSLICLINCEINTRVQFVNRENNSRPRSIDQSGNGKFDQSGEGKFV